MRAGDLSRFAAYTWLRRGELIALRWDDTDFAGHKLTVRRAIVRTSRSHSGTVLV
jgi:integrase